MRKAIILLGFATLLSGCGTVNEQVEKHTPLKGVARPDTVPYAAGLILSTPPVNTWLFGPCKEEFMIPDGRREQCELHAKLRDQTSVVERKRAAAQAAAYQPGELVCQRTLGFKTECVIVSGAPRPIQLHASPLMGAN